MSVGLLFSTTKGWDSRLIRLWTWSSFSHVDLIDGINVIGAVPGQGVVVVPIEERIRLSSSILVVSVNAPRERVTKLVRGQLGKPYDWGAIFSMVVRRDWADDDSWFCSELLAWAFRDAHHPLVNPNIPLNRVTPQMLLESPALT